LILLGVPSLGGYNYITPRRWAFLFILSQRINNQSVFDLMLDANEQL